jgi:CHAT domain
LVGVVRDLRLDGGAVALETALGELVNQVPRMDRAALRRRIRNVDASEAVREAILDVITRCDTSTARFQVSTGVVPRARDVPTRLSVLEVAGAIVASAVSNAATVPERELGLSVELFNQLIDLANTQAAGDIIAAGRLLQRLAIRPEFRPLLELDADVVIEVDRTTAALPWEILGGETTAPVQLPPLGLRTPLARQLRTRHSPPPGVTGRVVLTRALVIGDPASGAQHLPGAEREALAVAALLRERDVPCDVLMGPHGMTDGESGQTARPATIANVLHHLLHEEYQLVHYAGHGTFDAADPQRSTGWVLADGLLTGSHLTILERLPPLVVANACHSSRVSTGLPGLADDFIGHGVRNLVGTARTVDDDRARRFSEAFYTTMLPGDRTGGAASAPTLGNAMLAGRTALADRDWDVYQLYGDPWFRYWRDLLDRSPEDL